MMGQPWHGSYGSYLEDDGAIARELHQMYDSYSNLGGTSANCGGTYDDHGGSANRGGTSANCGGTYDDHGGSANRGGTSIRVSTNVQTRAGGEVDLDNMSYELLNYDHVNLLCNSSSMSESRCVVCKMEYERGDRLVTLPCAHQYHEDCIKKWMEDIKVDYLFLIGYVDCSMFFTCNVCS
ncbi:E3 ubiquitin ligase BIG BROTHER [Salix suchowensis]|nr:E3 ubiquitin ligase BIG BROTHER [Salix suchowensis]